MKEVRGALRHTALILAMAALSVQLAGWTHLASQRHATCSEHGELIEVGGDYGVTLEHARSSGLRFEAVDGGEQAHGHDHCLTAAHRHQRTALTHRSASIIALAGGSAASRSSAALSISSQCPLLLVAPKTSPPASV